MGPGRTAAWTATVAAKRVTARSFMVYSLWYARTKRMYKQTSKSVTYADRNIPLGWLLEKIYAPWGKTGATDAFDTKINQQP